MKDKFAKIDGFKIYVDRLKNGQLEKIDETFSPEFLDVNEKALFFEDPVHVEGEAYIAEGDLILNLSISTEAKMPCKICNELVKAPIRLQQMYQTEPLEEIKRGVFSMVNLIREAILLETPSFVECGNGQCAHRKEVEKYLRSSSSEEEDEGGYHPFEGIKLE
jgi:uncharacterized metal-binding protein YceD (DUF177 family)